MYLGAKRRYINTLPFLSFFRPWPRRHCVRWGPSSALPKKGAEPPPQFSAHVYCGQTAGWIKVALGKEVGLGPGHTVLDGDTAPLPQKRTEHPLPQFLAHVYCGQTAGWIKTPLGTEVDLGPCHFVLDRFPAIGERHSSPPLFDPYLLWPRSPISATAELLFSVQQPTCKGRSCLL